MSSASRNWLVSPRFDLAIFLGPAVVALALVPLGPSLAPTGALPLPMWLLAIVLIDVAHVWTTIYRTYLDKEELRRRPALYSVVPIAVYAVGVVLHSSSSAIFWTVLAYVAVFHFVRQQYGWVALYNRRAQDKLRIDRVIDGAAIYAATVIPILWWHANLPRKFEWFMKGDFITGLMPTGFVPALGVLWAAAMVAFVGRQVHRYSKEGVVRPGKIVVVVTTAACWGVGIVATNTDWAFTVTNVLIHGVPYMAIVWVYGRRSEHKDGSVGAWFFGARRWWAFYGLVVLLAYGEELGWDRLIWHEHGPVFFGGEVQLSSAVQALVVPLLALPQATHYVLDAWIWRTAKTQNPHLANTMALSPSDPEGEG